ncbi:NTP/NDP exchange transporter [Sansalvadorimonas sp. 2012CJ34-2]|uniref:ADP,ATP carrier protein n=1 Tax=Parendozoicomonas callyspongiae TaxID=2942213 RepID=A0ABT0PB91_9GAMM|nr:NTP/NDP exchange transporter [Sansalvadorimonas sp. 2012CJ34-2]MCL6268650.1 NTP/NDP exchange transporter [Sansalvadorimonas sp. 2012CJ34-2]
MLFCTVINFDIARNLKETLLVTRMGAEAIPFVKFWVVMPAALVFLITYSWLANHLSKAWLFRVSIIPFIIWMLAFTWLIYPALDELAPGRLCDFLENWLPVQLQIVTELLYYWPLVVLFTAAELWGAAVISILFWTTANDLHTSDSAEKSYPWIAMLGNLASLVSGPLILFCISNNSSQGAAGWQLSMNQLSVLFLINGIIILLLHNSCNKQRCKKSSIIKRQALSSESKAPVTHLPLTESIRFLSHSTNVRYIALVMLFYCVCINMLEVAWKSQVVQVFATELEYATFMGKMTLMSGFGCIVCGLCLFRLLSKGWQAAALATPVLMLITAVPFFLIVLYNQNQLSTTGFFSVELLSLSVYIGLISNVLSKSAKYTLFDATKEMVFVPLGNEEKYKGKAAIELLVSRLGKSGSAFMQQLLIIVLGSLSLAMIWLGGIFFIAVLWWLVVIGVLDKSRNNAKANPEIKVIT